MNDQENDDFLSLTCQQVWDDSSGVVGTEGGGKFVDFLCTNHYERYADNHDLFKDTFFQFLSQHDNRDHLVVRRTRWSLAFENHVPPKLMLNTYPYITIRRGDHVLPEISFTATGRPSALWPRWFESIFVNKSLHKLIEGLGILDDIEVFSFRHVTCSLYDLVCLILRRSPEVHIFLFAWGEATPTLEDVKALLRLPIHGLHPFEEAIGDNALNNSDKALLDILIVARKYSTSNPSSEKSPSKVTH
ncbi:hypothetical protein MKX01_008036, partial [Papaver californicum]